MTHMLMGLAKGKLVVCLEVRVCVASPDDLALLLMF